MRETEVRRWFLLLLLACVLRIGWWHFGPKVIETEGTNYARVGENIAAGRGLLGLDGNLSLIYPPLIPSLIAVGVRAGLESETAARLVSFLFGILMPIVVCAIGRRLYGASAGWLAGILAAAHPILIVLSTAVLSESTYLTLSFSMILCAIGVWAVDSKRPAVLMGIAAGLTYLTRPEGLVLFVLLGTVLVVFAGRQRSVVAARMGLALGVFAVFAVPWIVFLWQQTGELRFEAKSPQANIEELGQAQGKTSEELEWGLDANLDEVGMANSSDMGQVRLSRLQRRSRPISLSVKLAIKQVVQNVPHVLRRLGSGLFGQPVMAVLIGLGLFGASWSPARFRHEALFLVLIAMAVGFFLLWPWNLDRMLFILVGPIAIWAGLGLDRLRIWARETADCLNLPPIPSSALTAGMLITSMGLVLVTSAIGVRHTDEMSQSWDAERQEQVAVGKWLRSQGTGLRVVDSFLTAPFYAGDVLSDFPWTDSRTAVRYLEHRAPAFVIMHESQVNSRPYLKEWFERIPDARLTLVKTFDGTAGETRVYRWREVVASRNGGQ